MATIYYLFSGLRIFSQHFIIIFKYSNPSQVGLSAGRWSAKQYKSKNNKEDKLKQINRSVVQSRNAFAKLIITAGNFQYYFVPCAMPVQKRD